jgi:hypothetical protein
MTTQGLVLVDNFQLGDFMFPPGHSAQGLDCERAAVVLVREVVDII